MKVLWGKCDVLDHGHVRLLDSMGKGDISVVNAARVSFDKRSTYEQTTWEYTEQHPEGVFNVRCHGGEWCEGTVLRKRDQRLVAYLAQHGHWSPFAHQYLSFEVKAPMMVKNQWIKHRIGMSYLTDEDAEAWDNEGWNEKSLRYVEPDDFYVPADWRSAPEDKKQGSGANVDPELSERSSQALRMTIREGITRYQIRLEVGIAPEQARLVLPMYAMYTTFIWTTSLYGVIRFLQLRNQPDSQWEIQQYAQAIESLLGDRYYFSLKAFGVGPAARKEAERQQHMLDEGMIV